MLIKPGAGRDLSLDLRPEIPRNVECLEAAVFPDHCEALVRSIPASKTPSQVFGPENFPATTYVIPKTWSLPRK